MSELFGCEYNPDLNYLEMLDRWLDWSIGDNKFHCLSNKLRGTDKLR